MSTALTQTASVRVSVVIPVWDDYAGFLPACLASVLTQDEPVHVIVVDNASTRPLPPLPDGVRTLRLARRLTIGAARDAALAHVSTPYLLYLDADDELLPGALRFLRARLDAAPDAVAAIGRFLSFNPDTGEEALLARTPKPIVYPVSRLRRLFALLNLRYNAFPVVGCLHRVTALHDVGGFGPGAIGEDWVLGALLCFRGRIDFTRRPIFRRRVHRGSLWYRRHTPDALAAPRRALRRRLRADPRVPRGVKALLPLLARLHDRDVAARTRDGSFEPCSVLLPSQPGVPGRLMTRRSRTAHD